MDRGADRFVNNPAGAVRGDLSSALSLRGIAKRFGPTLALDGAWLEVRAGSIHAVLGENGAGKTTLMRLAFGMLQPDAGTIHLDGIARRWRSSADALDAGIGMVHQHFLLVPAMTVAENVWLGRGGMWGGYDPQTAAARVRALAAETGLEIDPSALVRDLPVGAQQRLEILKALSHDARVLILDEPTAVLSPKETADLYRWLRAFAASGRTVVLITHKIGESLQQADALTVLRRGRTVLTGQARDLDQTTVLSALLGAVDASSPVVRSAGTVRAGRGDDVITLERATVRDTPGVERLRELSMTVRGGEVLGVAGVEGAGQSELLRLLAGRLAPTTGTARLPATIGFVPEDRHRDAVIGEWTLTENFALKEAGRARGLMPWAQFATDAARRVAEFDVRTAGITSAMAALSGGNQQKFVLARELAGNPSALIVENPTRGLDVRATEQVLAALREASAAGVAVVMYSSDLDEIFALADRIVVCFDGAVHEVPLDREAVGRAMVGLPVA